MREMSVAPYGYRYKGNKLVKDSAEQLVIKAIVSLKRAGFSLDEIKVRLEERLRLSQIQQQTAPQA